MSEHLVHWSDRQAESSANGVVRRRLDGASAKLVRVEVPAGITAPAHSHPYEQFVEVLSGSGSLTTSAGTRRFAAGDVFHFPPDTDHAAVFEEHTVLLEVNLAS